MSKHHRTQGGKSSLLQLDRIYVRDQAVCWMCRNRIERTEATRDHMDCASQSQNHRDDNMRLACSDCNTARNDTPLTDDERFDHMSYMHFLRGLGLVKENARYPRVLNPTFGG